MVPEPKAWATVGELRRVLDGLPADAVPEFFGTPVLREDIQQLEPWAAKLRRGRLEFAQDGPYQVVSLRRNGSE